MGLQTQGARSPRSKCIQSYIDTDGKFYWYMRSQWRTARPIHYDRLHPRLNCCKKTQSSHEKYHFKSSVKPHILYFILRRIYVEHTGLCQGLICGKQIPTSCKWEGFSKPGYWGRKITADNVLWWCADGGEFFATDFTLKERDVSRNADRLCYLIFKKKW